MVVPRDAHQGVGHADHTSGNGAEFALDPLSFSSGPITRLRAKRFKEALNGLVQENWADSKKTKMGSNNNQGLVHVIKAIEEANACMQIRNQHANSYLGVMDHFK